ncbi:hypothetical protein EBT16_01390 [bacterium]|nr:hypothetical protein [bacterium]
MENFLRNGCENMTPKEAYDLIVSTGVRSREGEKSIASDANYSHLYAKHFLKGPFPAGEKSIREDAFAAYLYCKEIIGQRWYDAEDVIKKNPHTAYRYSVDVIGGRWEDAEKNIKKSPTWAGAYAENILRSRFKEAESSIAKKDGPASDYFRAVIKGDWKGWSETDISRSPVWMYYYARSLGHMLPEPMHSGLLGKRIKNVYADMYFKEFC